MSEPRNWLIYDGRSECYWGPNRGGYFKSIASAGLYTEVEAREAEDFAKRYDRQERAVPLSTFGEAIKRLHAALTEREAEDTLLGPESESSAPASTPAGSALADREGLAAHEHRYLRGLVRNASGPFVSINVDVLRKVLAALFPAPRRACPHCGLFSGHLDSCEYERFMREAAPRSAAEEGEKP